MIHYARIISCYTADTSGVCSALYELGGMVVVHDASGCNSTYATHDEPRWYQMDSMIYVSGLTEIDAVMGNDERWVIQSRCKIPTHPMHTNGMKSYISGASEAFEMLALNYCACTGKKKNSVNIIGATPLDLSRQEIVDSIWTWLGKCGFEKGCCMAMGSSLDEIRRAGEADVNLVVSAAGIGAADVMRDRFGIPYVTGLPVGIYEIQVQGFCGVVVVGESVYAGSLARSITMTTGKPVRVIHTLDTFPELALQWDKKLADEDKLEQEFSRCSCVVADPLFKPIVPANAKFVPIPHEAFSGRCFRKDIPDLVDKNLGLEL